MDCFSGCILGRMGAGQRQRSAAPRSPLRIIGRLMLLCRLTSRLPKSETALICPATTDAIGFFIRHNNDCALHGLIAYKNTIEKAFAEEGKACVEIYIKINRVRPYRSNLTPLI